MMNWLRRTGPRAGGRLPPALRALPLLALLALAGCAGRERAAFPRAFDFARDTFAFSNQLYWVYQPDPATGGVRPEKREPRPDYAHRCFPMARAAREFLYHARFAAGRPAVDEAAYRALIRQVVGRSARTPSPWNQRVVIPGYAGLREFSAAHEGLLKEACGGGGASHFQRGNWRMVFPFSRRHQAATARQLSGAVVQNHLPIVHLTDFPRLRINHAVVLFDVREQDGALEFSVYDPNLPDRPGTLRYDPARRRFHFPATHYYAGGDVQVYEAYRGWCY
ncbi:MAG: hypothetical protein RJA22_547 [Verrucomicrobiota bacterium]|jgi:hypothetical protein